ncbi:MAG: ATP-binding protein [Defluviitaleaceae bacterium]|nr:ATP-binding protein [Defluviitaleaceae bacterium]
MGRIYIVSGFYGSGKTEFCVNLALNLRNSDDKTITIADLDVINPYFRSREKETQLAAHNIEIMGNALDNNTGQDLPAVSFAFTSRIVRGDNVILDLAGGENGIKLLASCYNAIENSKAPYEFLCVLNLFRPETNDAAKMVDFVRKINAISKLSVTGLVNNGHMLHDTTAQHVLASQQAVCEAADVLGIPVRYTQLRRDIYEGIADKIASEKMLIFEKLAMRESWQ